MKQHNGKISLGVFCLIVFTQAAYASNTIPLTHFFNISTHDTSLKLLAQLLGDVGGLLPSSSMQLLGFMFKDFNQAMLVLATIIIGYTVTMATIQTANEGEFLGKKFHSLWVPVRTATGIALVVPTTYGYSIIQIGIMWVVMQGVGLADTLWGQAVTFLQGGGGIVAPISTIPAKTIGKVSNMFNVILCANVQENRILPAYSSANEVTFKDTMNNKDCGKISWSSTDQYIIKELNSALPAVISTLNSIAYDYVQAKGDYGVLIADGNPILISAKDINSAIESGVNNNDSQSAKNNNFVKMAIDYGWANAGAYYYKIAQLNESTKTSGDINQIVTVIDALSLPENVKSDANALQKDASAKLIEEQEKSQGKLVDTKKMKSSAEGSELTSGATLVMGAFAAEAKAPFIPVVAAFAGLFGILGGDFFGQNSVDPIVKLQVIGAKVCDAVVAAYGVIAIVAIGLGAVAGICTSIQPLAVVFSAVTKYLITPIVAMLAFIYPVGLLMAVYLPVIPYIIFTFGVIGWMIAVLESMIAGPIVALGVTHPEGQHEVFGRAEPAIQLILNLFLRPALMIFGLMGGMILSYVTIGFVNVVYGQILSGIIWWYVPIKYFAFIMVYVYLVIAILNHCFSLIHLFPDQVLRWIGNQASFGEYSKGEEQVRAGFDKTAEATGGALHKQAEAGMQAGGEIQKGLSDWKKEKEAEVKEAVQAVEQTTETVAKTAATVA